MSTAETIAESPAGSWAVRRVAAWWAMAVAVADPLPGTHAGSESNNVSAWPRAQGRGAGAGG